MVYWGCSALATGHGSSAIHVESKERRVLSYRSANGRFPYREWRNSLNDQDTEVAVDVRITRFNASNFGDSRPIGGGAFESRIDFGPGYRIYFGTDGDEVILLCGGDKSTQDADIARAKEHWKDYKRRNRAWKSQRR